MHKQTGLRTARAGLAGNDAIRARRDLLKLAGASLALLVSPPGFAASSLLAVRVWPADDYTRITLEGRGALKYTHLLIKNPDRLVVDLEGIKLDSVLQSLSTKVLDSDPYIKLIRAGQNRPGVVRLVVELKSEISPQVFTLDPVGHYGHRLVLDLYPANPVDPLLALIEKSSPIDAAAGDAAPAESDDDAAARIARGDGAAPSRRSTRAWSPSFSIPATAARTPAR